MRNKTWTKRKTRLRAFARARERERERKRHLRARTPTRIGRRGSAYRKPSDGVGPKSRRIAVAAKHSTRSRDTRTTVLFRRTTSGDGKNPDPSKFENPDFTRNPNLGKRDFDESLIRIHDSEQGFDEHACFV
jgi:hypothetical protein